MSISRQDAPGFHRSGRSVRVTVVRHLLLAVWLASAAGAASAQTAAFTYQGRLTDDAAAATGTYDMEFRLFDAPGTQLGASITIPSVAVTNGIFTVQLNSGGEFGTAPFEGADRFLEIAVRRPGDPAYTTLVPRQQLTATPYSSRSRTAGDFTGTLSGDVTGSQGATIVHAIQGAPLGVTTGASPGDILKWDGAGWSKSTPGPNVASVGTTAPLANTGTATDPVIAVTGVVQVANGGTGSGTQNFVDLTSSQTVGGTKSFSSNLTAPSFVDANNGGYYVDPASATNLNDVRFVVVPCINGYCPPNNAIRLTPNLHFNSSAGYAVIVNWDNGNSAGSTQMFRVGNGLGSDAFYVRADGFVRATSNIQIGSGTTGCVQDADATIIAGTCSSDARLKTAITPFPPVLDKLARLEPVSFRWKASEFRDRKLGSAPSFGLVAQDVEKILPELVTEDAEGYKAVRYHKLPLLLLEGMKELKEANDSLRRQDDRLRSELAALRALVCQDHPDAEVCR